MCAGGVEEKKKERRVTEKQVKIVTFRPISEPGVGWKMRSDLGNNS